MRETVWEDKMCIESQDPQESVSDWKCWTSIHTAAKEWSVLLEESHMIVVSFSFAFFCTFLRTNNKQMYDFHTEKN